MSELTAHVARQLTRVAHVKLRDDEYRASLQTPQMHYLHSVDELVAEHIYRTERAIRGAVTVGKTTARYMHTYDSSPDTYPNDVDRQFIIDTAWEVGRLARAHFDRLGYKTSLDTSHLEYALGTEDQIPISMTSILGVGWFRG